MEKEIAIQAYQVAYHCDECGEPMQGMGVQFPTNPPQFPHQCQNGHQINLPVVYPTVRYREIETVQAEWKSSD